jgi:FMN-dependent NADH-azoreductase
MNTLLQIHTSLNGADSLSSSLADEYIAAWQRKNPGGRVITRDLSTDPVPHLTAARFAAFLSDDEARSDEERSVVAYSDGLIAEVHAADEIVLGLPMHNFGIPSTLKAYFDHIARVGVTFRYTDQGPVGLLTGKRALIFATRGGKYVGTPLDTQTDYIRNFFAFLGIADIGFVYAEGTAMGEDTLAAAIAGARKRIGELAVRPA